MFKKSAVDITRLIKRALDVDVSLYSSSELFICTAIFYLRRLKRFEKITEMMQEGGSQLYSFFSEVVKCKIICFSLKDFRQQSPTRARSGIRIQHSRKQLLLTLYIFEVLRKENL